jgi:hypothetical protein
MKMARSKSVLTWCFRAMWSEDPALRRISSLKTCRNQKSQSGIPVFFRRKARLA